jgi:hypothetical protein
VIGFADALVASTGCPTGIPSVNTNASKRQRQAPRYIPISAQFCS